MVENNQKIIQIEKKEESKSEVKEIQKEPIKPEKIKPELPKPIPQQQYLNMRLEFPKATVDVRKKRLEQVVTKLRMFVSTFMRFESDSDSFCITYQLPMDIGLNRKFKPFTTWAIKIFANISDEALYDVVTNAVQVNLVSKEGVETPAYVSPSELVKNLEILSGGVTYEKTNYNRFAKFIVENRNLIKNEKYPDRVEWTIDLENFFPENDVKDILSNFDLFYSALEESFHFLDSNTNLLMFEPLHIPGISDYMDLMEKNGKLVNFYGFLRAKDYCAIEGKMRPVLLMRSDSQSLKVPFKVFLMHNDNYYSQKIDTLVINTGIRIVGQLTVDEKHNCSINAFTLKTTAEKTFIRSWYMLKGDSNFYYENDFRDPEPGMYIRAYKVDKESITYNKRFSKAPLEVLQIYNTEDDEELYQLRLGNSEIFGEFDTIIESLKKNKYMKETGDEVRNCVHNIIHEMIIQQQLKPKRAYTAPGVQLDENMNLALIIPQTHNILTMNGKAEEAVKCLRVKSYFLDDKESEKRKEVIKAYFDAMNYKGQSEPIRAGTFGFAAIGSFYKVLSKDKSIDVLPICGMVGIGGAGKTKWMRLTSELFNGVDLQNGSEISTKSRLRDVLGMMALISIIDDIQKMHPDVIGDLKAVLTGFKPLSYKERNQTWVKINPMGPFFFSSNNLGWLNDDDAFRDGRVMLYHTYARIEDPDLKDEFDRIQKIILSNSLLGLYFLKFIIKSIGEYRKFLIECGNESIKTDLDALVFKIDANKKYIKRLGIEQKIRFLDPRRTTIYALILSGLQFWESFFQSELGEVPEFLERMLVKDSPQFVSFIQNSENEGWDSRLEQVMQVREFIRFHYHDEQKATRDERQIFRKPGENVFYLTSNFVAHYNEWALKCGFPIYKNLPDMQTMINKVANPPLEYKTRTFNLPDDSRPIQDKTIDFDVKALLKEELPHIDVNPFPQKKTEDIALERSNQIWEKCKELQDKEFDEATIIENCISIDGLTKDFIKHCIEKFCLENKIYHTEKGNLKITSKNPKKQ
jgi:hypothetical protein